jgi:DNA-binding NarL/FixJ family response regulator
LIEVIVIAPVRAHWDALRAAMREGGLAVVAGACTAAEAVASIAPRQPAVALLDFGSEDLARTLALLPKVTPSTRLVAYGIRTTRNHRENVVNAAQSGVMAFVGADQPLDDVVLAATLAVRGESSCDPRIAAVLLRSLRRLPAPPQVPLLTTDAASGEALTPRERLVAELAASGMTNRQIAAQLVLGESTVKSHIHAVLRKLRITTRKALPSRLDPVAHGDVGPSLCSPTSTGGGGAEAATPPVVSIPVR